MTGEELFALRDALLPGYPRSASHDEEGALRLALARLLARGYYVLPGGERLRAAVIEGNPGESPDGTVEIHDEWADGNHAARFPHITIGDSIGVWERSMDAHIDEDSAWPPDAPEQVALRVTGEYVIELPLMIQGNHRAERMAIVKGVRALLEGSHAEFWDGVTLDRQGVLVDTGELFWSQSARFIPVRMQRADAEDKAGQSLRAAVITVRASILVVEPVALPILRSVGLIGPTEGDPEYDDFVSLEL